MTVEWLPFTEAHLPALLEFCLDNEAYYTYIKCVPDTENLRQELRVLPPGAQPEQRYFAGRWEAGRLTAILDVVRDWPRPGVAYIGWFMVARRLQRAGLGRRTIERLCADLKAKGYHTLRLACAVDNLPGLAFWRSCGFSATGERADLGAYTVALLEKHL